ncbi:MAG: zinc ribbon domain-containing protein [Steroidobacteraceae bacterium]
MPFYEYQCKSCGHTLEAMQKVNDSPLKKCPECGKPQLTRLMSAPVFRLKGGGWYETDFKGGQDNKKNLAERPEADAPKERPPTRLRRRNRRRNRPAAGSPNAAEPPRR